MGREGAVAHEVRVMFHFCRAFKQPKIYVSMLCINSLCSGGFHCIRLKSCVGSVGETGAGH